MNKDRKISELIVPKWFRWTDKNSDEVKYHKINTLYILPFPMTEKELSEYLRNNNILLNPDPFIYYLELGKKSDEEVKELIYINTGYRVEKLGNDPQS